MPTTRTIDTPLLHPGTERRAAVVRVEDFWEAVPLSVPTGPFVLVVVSLREARHSSTARAREWVNAGAHYLCAWGPDSEEVEETFDYASFLPELGGELPFTLMTTHHREESLEEALWFAFYNGVLPEDPDDPNSPVVVVTDMAELEQRCVEWVRTNLE